jgi:hypothetical protein
MFLIMVPSLLYSQGNLLKGSVTDKKNGQPVPLVTVYINGTSLGTISDMEGNFMLRNIPLPCELIFSHVSYNLKRIELPDTTQWKEMSINLEERVIELKEATVIHDQLKTDYLRRFKSWFLGIEYEKYGADILNDSVLIFNTLENEQFSVYADEPIQVFLPSTGYSINVDLVRFDLRYRSEIPGYHCSILGYYFFNPVAAASRREQRSLERNRAQSYYNSSMHFCKSLYHNQLAENGYLLERNCVSDSLQERVPASVPDFIGSYGQDAYGNQRLELTRLACKNFRITYNYNGRNRPVDLTYLDSNPSRIEWSGLTFLKDTIHIYPSGRIPENAMLFSGSIGEKGVAFMLPEDYIPSMQ